MSLKLRKAIKTDMESVLILIKELATFEKESEAVEVTVDELIKDGFGENPAFEVFVAELDDEIVGMALFYQRYSTWKGKTIHLEDLIVTQSHRGKGIGNALYTKILKHAYNLGVKRVEWAVLDWNTIAIDFYKSTGAAVFNDWQVAQMDENSLKQFVQNSLNNS